MSKKTVSLALEEGFLRDAVRVSVSGRCVTELNSLSSRVQTGHARTIEIEVDEGATALTVELPEKKLVTDIPLDGAATAYVGVSVTSDGKGLRVRTSASPPGYV